MVRAGAGSSRLSPEHGHWALRIQVALPTQTSEARTHRYEHLLHHCYSWLLRVLSCRQGPRGETRRCPRHVCQCEQGDGCSGRCQCGWGLLYGSPCLWRIRTEQSQRFYGSTLSYEQHIPQCYHFHCYYGALAIFILSSCEFFPNPRVLLGKTCADIHHRKLYYALRYRSSHTVL